MANFWGASGIMCAPNFRSEVAVMRAIVGELLVGTASYAGALRTSECYEIRMGGCVCVSPRLKESIDRQLARESVHTRGI